MVGHASMDLIPTTVSAIQVFMAASVIVTTTSVHHNLAVMGELVQMVLPSIIANVRPVSQVCLFTVFSISLVNVFPCDFMKWLKYRLPNVEELNLQYWTNGFLKSGLHANMLQHSFKCFFFFFFKLIGRSCETIIDSCLGNQCKNGATCVSQQYGYSCKCMPGYGGQLCEVNIDECAANPCQHGQCRDGVNRYICDCYAGYTGTNCDVDIDDCKSR